MQCEHVAFLSGVRSDAFWKTTVSAATEAAEWGEEFCLPVRDPNEKVQLECTLWDETNSQVLSKNRLNSCAPHF